jgi:hypothetical protein
MQHIMQKGIISTQVKFLLKFKMAAVLNFTTMLPFHYH